MKLSIRGMAFSMALLWGAVCMFLVGLTKMICDADTGRVIGVGITGVHAGDMIAEAALAIEMGATAEDIAATIHPHPTLSETYQDTADMFGAGAVH